ncbi:MAG: response regulator transcription factor [Tepidiformaceae bacterium]
MPNAATAAQPLVLAVDDDAGILRVIAIELADQGFRVITSNDGEEAIAMAAKQMPDIALVDLMMPEVNGIEVMKRIRANRAIPVIFVTARDRDADKVRGLELGADDYVVKPFGPEELGARIRAVLRRANAPAGEAPPVRAGNVEVDLARRIVTRDGAPVSLTRTEWLLIQHFAQHPRKVLLYQDILAKVWGPEYREDSQYLRVWVSRLRAKLETTPSQPQIIKTHMGIGYTFVAEEERTAEDDEMAALEAAASA